MDSTLEYVKVAKGVYWTKPLTLSLLFGTFADLARRKKARITLSSWYSQERKPRWGLQRTKGG